MNTFLFTQITNTILGILIVGDIVSLINKKYKVTGIISIVLAILILLIGIITPVSIVVCTIGAIIWVGFGVFSILKDIKKKKSLLAESAGTWKGVFDFERNAVLLLTKGKGEFSLR